ncbi:hypothetical protein [Photobacterium damselae]|uniref:hypothetical protein n=1 Tax=Photobacterium damselae TaxID=38293 RepID=UPI001F2436A4|nr:hypothetical protein [Photobacterium damselae]UKA29891.1 hypothetical protein IPQ37_04140 [Photobacterium damselae subsp. damselae]
MKNLDFNCNKIRLDLCDESIIIKDIKVEINDIQTEYTESNVNRIKNNIFIFPVDPWLLYENEKIF